MYVKLSDDVKVFVRRGSISIIAQSNGNEPTAVFLFRDEVDALRKLLNDDLVIGDD